jgi:hypothetical protein
MYKLVKDQETGEVIGVHTNDGKTFIPFFEGNRHYQEYLQWLAEGNEPLPADGEEVAVSEDPTNGEDPA